MAEPSTPALRGGWGGKSEKEERRAGAPRREKAHPKRHQCLLAVLFFTLALVVVDADVDSISRFA